MLPGFHNPQPGPPALRIVQGGSWGLLKNQTIFTIPGLDIGTPGPNRKINFLLEFADESNITLNTLTLDGVACTRITRAVAAASNTNVEIWEVEPVVGSALYLAGTATLVATFSSTLSFSFNGKAIAVYEAGGLLSTVAATNNTAGAGLVASPINYAEAGYALAVGQFEDTSTGGAISGYTTVFGGGSNWFVGGYMLNGPAQTGQSVTLSFSGSAAFRRLCAAAWKLTP